MNYAITLAENGRLPDSLIRAGIRSLLAYRMVAEKVSPAFFDSSAFADMLRESPLAVHQDAANEQHYELPTEFFSLALGQHKKYSGCYWNEDTTTLDEAERLSLEIVAQRAELQPGQQVLDLGCGWGSFSLWAAAQYPESTFTAVSNSSTQREYIEKTARDRGIHNLRVITSDIVAFEPEEMFDRIVSIEMFEHLRNYELLFSRLSSWLLPNGKTFIHVFCHRAGCYFFETEGASNWMGKYFFTGGLMPSADLFSEFQRSDFTLEQQWFVNGNHYAKTAEAWLENMDHHSERIMELMIQTYGEKDALVWYNRWRMFFMSCAELFAYRSGSEWHIGHYRFAKK